MDILIPSAFALLVWWFFTGVILLLVRRDRSTFRYSIAGATSVLVGAAYFVTTSAARTTVADAYIAFGSAIALWGWLEITFLMGMITGPRVHACRDRCDGMPHFFHAVQAILYNELATAFAAAVLFFAVHSSPNRVALYAFLILWGMRISAKLNLYLGVPNLGERLLPAHLKYLTNFFRKRPMNLLFPLSVTAGTILVGFEVRELLIASGAFQTTSVTLCLSLTVLGLLEHWFMVLPLASERLWAWAVNFAASFAIPNPR